jgi:hypothetical protein
LIVTKLSITAFFASESKIATPKSISLATRAYYAALGTQQAGSVIIGGVLFIP